MIMTLENKIRSIGEAVGSSYERPDPSLVEKAKNALQDSDEAWGYLDSRNIGSEAADYFNLGYDEEKHAITLPVYKRGELINLRYRFIDPNHQPKYIQTKGAETWLYHEQGIKHGIEKTGVLIVEGEFDLISCWQAGIENVISPTSGKDSYGPWLELLDKISKIYIAYDNDKPGREAAQKLASRIGEEKCQEVLYPEGIKDANDYFQENTIEEFRELLKEARPFYQYQFSGLGDILEKLSKRKGDRLTIDKLPGVKLGDDWVVMISGITGVGKTSYVLNLTNDLVERDIPTLILPFERGPEVVGERFLQVRYNITEGDTFQLEETDWQEYKEDCRDLPLYFSMPKQHEAMEIVKKAKRIFNTQIVIVDHLDYAVSNIGRDKLAATSQFMHEIKEVAIEEKIIFLVVHHLRKLKSPGTTKTPKPTIEDLKGDSSVMQVPEAVVLLSSADDELTQLEVDVVKNKGRMKSVIYEFNIETGKLGQEAVEDIDDVVKSLNEDETW